MVRNMKKLVCGILAVFMLSTLFMVPAGATGTSGSVRIIFYKPADWADSVKIHLWNAGSADTQWPGSDMTKLDNGKYQFETDATGSCDFVINDGNGRQTSDLHAEGSVKVKNDTVIKGCTTQNAIRINFQKPDGWSDDIKYYYYTNDGKGISFTDWPGTSMTKYVDGAYYAKIYDMDDARVIFTDGTNQYPAPLQPGIAVKDGQELIFQDGKYTVNDHNWIQADQPTNFCVKGETYKCKFVMDEGSHFDLYFRERSTGNFIQPTGVTTVKYNRKVTSEYSFQFSEPGNLKLDVLYYYHSGFGATGITLDIKIDTADGYYTFSSDKNDFMLGEEFKITIKYNEELWYSFRNDAGEEVKPKDVSYIDKEGTANHDYAVYTFAADKIGQFQKLHIYSHHYRYPIPNDTGRFITLNVWANA